MYCPCTNLRPVPKNNKSLLQIQAYTRTPMEPSSEPTLNNMSIELARLYSAAYLFPDAKVSLLYLFKKVRRVSIYLREVDLVVAQLRYYLPKAPAHQDEVYCCGNCLVQAEALVFLFITKWRVDYVFTFMQDCLYQGEWTFLGVNAQYVVFYDRIVAFYDRIVAFYYEVFTCFTCRISLIFYCSLLTYALAFRCIAYHIIS